MATTFTVVVADGMESYVRNRLSNIGGIRSFYDPTFHPLVEQLSQNHRAVYEAVQQLLSDNHIIAAVKLVREVLDVNLSVAKAITDSMR